MNILQVHNYYRIRGGECSVVAMEKELLSSHGHRVNQFVSDSSSINDMGYLEKMRMFFNIPYNRPAFNAMVEMIRDKAPDVAHVHNVFPLMSPSVYAALKSCGIPVVQTLHNYRFLCPNGQFFIRGSVCEDCQTKGYFRAVLKKCVRDSRLTSVMYANAISNAWKSGILPGAIDRYIALNNFVANKMVSAGIPRNKIEICGNYIDSAKSSTVIKQNYILYLGRLSNEKGIGTLLRAMSLLNGVELRVAGSGPEESKLRREALALDGVKVQFLGHIGGDYKQQIIEEALCTVVPSEWYENFPISIVESMSLGTPVIASDMGGLPDMIQHGLNGLLFEAGNHVELADCIRTIVNDTKNTISMAENAARAAKEIFGPDEHYRQLIRIYQAAINGGN